MVKKINISEETKSEKNLSISATLAETRERRKTQSCKVIIVKIQSNKLNQRQSEALKMLFVEAKWIKNEMIGFGQNNSIFDYDCSDCVKVMNKDKEFEFRELKFISSQQKQSVIAEVKDNIKALSKNKQKGNKVGSLKFTSEVKSVNLKQYNNTYRIKSQTKMKIQGIPGYIKVKGLEQLDPDCEFANAKLIKKPDGYYIVITTYIDNDKIKDNFIPNTDIGVDMGVKDNIILSNRTKINVFIEETERLKKLQRELSRREKSSNNRYKTVQEIRKEYQKMGNIKDDKANKIVSEIKQYENIYFQDENLTAWKNKKSLARGSKKIHHSVLGRVKTKLKNCDRAFMLDRFVPTTQTCVCGKKNKLELSDRIYRCSCGYVEDRDFHSSDMMIILGKQIQKQIGMECTKSTPVETCTSAMPALRASKSGSVKQEAAESLAQR